MFVTTGNFLGCAHVHEGDGDGGGDDASLGRGARVTISTPGDFNA